MTKPFEGVRVIDFTQVYAGPFASYQLALHGADVVKVERPGGEEFRFSAHAPEWSERSMGPMWLAVNANKRNIALDLKKPEAVEIVKRLVKDADIVMENYRPGVMDRLGIGYDALTEVNPTLIYCAISGFGQEGPEKNTPAYDGRIQATSGIMSITGHAETGPTRAGFAVCDAIGGMTGAFAISSALFQRTRTGKPQFIDVSMLDAALTFLSPAVCEYTVGGIEQAQMGNQAVSRKATADLFRVKGGYMLLAVNSEGQFRALIKEIGREDILDDPRFLDWNTRRENAEGLREIVQEKLLEEDVDTWQKRLDAVSAPAAKIWRIDEVVDHPQLAHRDVMQTIETSHGDMRLVGPGFKLAHGGGEVSRAPALPGEHNKEVLEDAGYTAAEIDTMLKEGVFG
ncbi:MAG: CoA transferase [Rhodospirillaceae bacterium]|nr:CoA transferase [Rhodospirillaceae bacterium]